jgi:hypothetical protein
LKRGKVNDIAFREKEKKKALQQIQGTGLRL